MKYLLVFVLGMMVVGMVATKEHKPSPCAGGKLIRKVYWQGRLQHQDYTTGIYRGSSVGLDSARCWKCKKEFLCDEITVEIVK